MLPWIFNQPVIAMCCPDALIMCPPSKGAQEYKDTRKPLKGEPVKEMQSAKLFGAPLRGFVCNRLTQANG